jgi:hypothetical protein
MIRLALLAGLLGSALGAGYVFADTPAPERIPAVATPTVSPAPHDAYNLAATSAKRIVLQVSDPKGGAPWAARTYTGRDATETLDCLDVGRIVDGRFGWLDTAGAFQASTPLTICDAPDLLEKIGAQASRTDTVDAHDMFSRSVTWGHAAPDVTAVAPGGEPAIPVAGGVFLTASATQQPAGPIGALVHADGRRTPLHAPPALPFRGERPIPGTRALGAVAPDPAGGLPWGLIVMRGDRGHSCAVLPGRLVGTQLGSLNGDLFSPDPLEDLMAQCDSRLLLDTLIAAGELDSAGRIERRVLDGRTVLYGVLDPRVTSVTITTPSDVRTLVPTAQHGVLAVYQGTFPVGRLTATATYRDGHTVTRRLQSGGV